MTRRELEQGIMERKWQIRLWPKTCGDDLKEEIYQMQDQLTRIESDMVMRVCLRAICTFDLGFLALEQSSWDEDAAVFLLMRVRCKLVA